MWRQYINDTPSSLAVIFSNEASSEHFEPELIIKDTQEVEKVKETLLENFDIVNTYYKVKLATALEKYPKLDYHSAISIENDFDKFKTTEE